MILRILDGVTSPVFSSTLDIMLVCCARNLTDSVDILLASDTSTMSSSWTINFLGLRTMVSRFGKMPSMVSIQSSEMS